MMCRADCKVHFTIILLDIFNIFHVIYKIKIYCSFEVTFAHRFNLSIYKKLSILIAWPFTILLIFASTTAPKSQQITEYKVNKDSKALSTSIYFSKALKCKFPANNQYIFLCISSTKTACM